MTQSRQSIRRCPHCRQPDPVHLADYCPRLKRQQAFGAVDRLTDDLKDKIEALYAEIGDRNAPDIRLQVNVSVQPNDPAARLVVPNRPLVAPN